MDNETINYIIMNQKHKLFCTNQLKRLLQNFVLCLLIAEETYKLLGSASFTVNKAIHP